MEIAKYSQALTLQEAYVQYIAVLSSLIYKLSSSRVSFDAEGQAKVKTKDLFQVFHLAHECLYSSENILMGRLPDWRNPHSMQIETDGQVESVPPTDSGLAAVSCASVVSLAASHAESVIEPDLPTVLSDMNEEETLPLIPLSPLSRMYIVLTRRLAKASREYTAAKRPPKDRNQPAVAAAIVRRLDEDVRMQRAKVDEVVASIKSVTDKSLLSWEPDALARQWCVLDASLFAKCDPQRDLHTTMADTDSVRVFGEPVEACVDFERHVTNSVAHLLIVAAYENKTYETVFCILKAAARLKDLYRNFNAFAALVRALCCSAVSRLPTLWDRIPRKMRDVAQSYLKLLDPGRLYNRYITALEQVLDERQLEVSGAEAMLAVPWMRAHCESARAIYRAYKNGKNLNDIGTSKMETMHFLLDRCRRNANGQMSTSALAISSNAGNPVNPPPPSLKRLRRRTHFDIDGTKSQISVPLDLLNIPNPDLSLQHWILSRVYLTKEQLWEESQQVKPLETSETAQEEYRVGNIEVEVENRPMDRVLSAAEEIRAVWHAAPGERPSTPIVRVDASSPKAESVLSVDGFIDFLDESILYVKGMDRPMMTPSPTPPESSIPPPLPEELASGVTLEDKAMEEVIRSLKPEFSKLREELENVQIRRAKSDLAQRLEKVRQEVDKMKGVSAEPAKPIEIKKPQKQLPWVDFPASPQPTTLLAELSSSRPITPQMNGTLAAELIYMSRAENVIVDELTKELKGDVDKWMKQEKKDVQKTERKAQKAMDKADETTQHYKDLRERLKSAVAKRFNFVEEDGMIKWDEDDEEKEVEELIAELTEESKLKVELKSSVEILKDVLKYRDQLRQVLEEPFETNVSDEQQIAEQQIAERELRELEEEIKKMEEEIRKMEEELEKEDKEKTDGKRSVQLATTEYDLKYREIEEIMDDLPLSSQDVKIAEQEDTENSEIEQEKELDAIEISDRNELDVIETSDRNELDVIETSDRNELDVVKISDINELNVTEISDKNELDVIKISDINELNVIEASDKKDDISISIKALGLDFMRTETPEAPLTPTDSIPDVVISLRDIQQVQSDSLVTVFRENTTENAEVEISDISETVTLKEIQALSNQSLPLMQAATISLQDIEAVTADKKMNGNHDSSIKANGSLSIDIQKATDEEADSLRNVSLAELIQMSDVGEDKWRRRSRRNNSRRPGNRSRK